MKSNSIYSSILLIVILFVLAGFSCESPPETLKDAFKDHFYMGTTINRYQLEGNDTGALRLAETHFNTITAENELKWERIHPEPGVYNFEPADQFVEFAEKNGMYIIGHCLLWHSQTPEWVFEDEPGIPATRDTLLNRMKEHIFTVMERYKGRVHCWDLINEPVGDDGQLRKTKWVEIIGDDFYEKAFEFARKADPGAALILNDYSLPNTDKRECMVRLIKDLQSKGITIDGVGMQGHYQLDYPSMADLEASILAFAETGLPVMITELDIDVLPRATFNRGADVNMSAEYRAEINPYTDGLPDSVAVALARKYEDLFTVFIKHSDKIDRVTFWGVHDGQSWKNNWPVRGRTNYPLLFDRNYQPKLAFEAVMNTAGR